MGVCAGNGVSPVHTLSCGLLCPGEPPVGFPVFEKEKDKIKKERLYKEE